MKRMMQSTTTRVLAFVFCIFCGLTAIVSAGGYIASFVERDNDLPEPECTVVYQNTLRETLSNIVYAGIDTDIYEDLPSGYSYTIKDLQTNKIIADTRSKTAVSTHQLVNVYGTKTLEAELFYEPNEVPDEELAVLRSTMTTVLQYKNTYLPIGILALLLCIAAFVFLMASAGKTADGIQLRGFNRMPLDLFLFLAALLFFLSLALAGDAAGRFWFIYVRVALRKWLIPCCILIAWEGMIMLGTCCTLAARFRGGKWWKNSIIYKLGRFAWRTVLGLCHALPAAWTGLAVYTAVVVVNFIGMLMAFFAGSAFLLLLCLAFDAAGFYLVIRIMRQLQTLQTAGQKLAGGDLSYTVDTENMLPVLKEHGENLNAVSVGMSRAVNERMKSERFKTELITNVSHDLKTPLTSIVSYVDLLKKEPIESEKARGYIDVLERQSQKLKKLTTDLVDASKASSGAIPVNLEKLDLVELVRQSAGEYTEKFAAAAIDPVLTLPEEEVFVCADGRLLWRVLDNLLGNAVKYAQSGTRLYMDIEQKDGETDLIIKNISREPLNIPAEELMERFVRGDSSRHTDGSGLGLSIASSLMELMGGRLTLQLDGDLFKALLIFPQKQYKTSLQVT
jgi:signal transduction histidine kinase